MENGSEKHFSKKDELWRCFGSTLLGMGDSLSRGLGVENVRGATVRPLTFQGDDESLARALKVGHPGAKKALYERYARHVRGVIVRTLGTNTDLSEHLNEVFLQAFKSSSGLKDGSRLKAWLTQIAVRTAIAHIRKSGSGRWLRFWPPERLPDVPAQVSDDTGREAVRQVYEILDHMSAKERIPFSLRIIDGMPVADVADACSVSVATIKRRISKAEKRFYFLAGKKPALREWIEESSKRRNP